MGNKLLPVVLSIGVGAESDVLPEAPGEMVRLFNSTLVRNTGNRVFWLESQPLDLVDQVKVKVLRCSVAWA